MQLMLLQLHGSYRSAHYGTGVIYDRLRSYYMYTLRAVGTLKYMYASKRQLFVSVRHLSFSIALHTAPIKRQLTPRAMPGIFVVTRASHSLMRAAAATTWRAASKPKS